jgi:hypothetical protein
VSAYEKLDSLNIALPELTPPVAAFVPFLRSGNLLFLAGHIPKMNGKPWVGQLGARFHCSASLRYGVFLLCPEPLAEIPGFLLQ